MGSNFATELAELDLGLSLEDSIGIHLQANHFVHLPYSTIADECIERRT